MQSTKITAACPVRALIAAGLMALHTPPAYADPAAQAAPVTIPTDLRLLVGNHVIVGRMPLCVPRSYTPDLAHAGQTAMVVSFRPNTKLAALPALARLPASIAATFADLRQGGMMFFRFSDGVELDTCGDLGAHTIAENLDPAPGEVWVTEQSPAPMESAATAPLPAQLCPMAVLGIASGVSFSHMLAEALTTSEFQRRLDSAVNGGPRHYLDIQIRNDSSRPISAFEFTTAYANRIGDDLGSSSFVSPNEKDIAPSAVFKASVMDRASASAAGYGKVTVSISRIRFSDGSDWRDIGSHNCAASQHIRF